ncbi:ComEA family DNA-binding protein, partial [Bacteroides faecis]|uniref:ComEA family DNA-binding protein n=2 Tax=Bacteroides TaxID=816 RepID=UPI0034A177F5
MWKDFFYFTKTERQGIIVLVVLVIGAYAIPRLLQAFSQPEKTNPAEQVKAEKEYSDFISSVKKLKPGKKYPDYTNNRSSAVHPKKEIRLATFDPNMADSTTFLSLGLPSWMASNILRYRNRQGRFRRPEDFRKIYGLTEEQYRTLLPYIRIAEEPISPDTSRLLVVQATAQHDTLMKYHPGIIIDLNQADTTELKKIPGIGSRIAQSIVNRRRLLGGFYQIEQLEEIRLKVEKLRSWFSVDATQIHRININKASVERMMHHPYINFYQAKVIAEYRKKKGKLRDLKQLA